MDDEGVPPSSPPHVSTASVPSSPFPELNDGMLAPKSSSPPPLFSSDDSDVSVDVGNYESPRIFKNKRKGTWWEGNESAHNTPEPRKKRTMTRNYDSGVHMLSDGSSSSQDLQPQMDEAGESNVARPHLSSLDMAEAEFQCTMYNYMDKHLELYDFGEKGIDDRDIRRIGDIKSVIKNLPDAGTELPAELQYRSFVPGLAILLQKNQLRRLTPSLFHLEYLTTLILRHNLIDELPPQIANLRHLVHLDVSFNQLQFLPIEMLNLFGPSGKLDIFPTFDNKFPLRLSMKWSSIVYDTSSALARPESPLDKSVDHCLEKWAFRSRKLEMEKAMTSPHKETALASYHPCKSGVFRDIPGNWHTASSYFARTLVSYYDGQGRLILGSAKLPTYDTRNEYAVLVDLESGVFGVPSSPWFVPDIASAAVPSLLSMAMRTALRQRQIEGLSIDELRAYVGEPLPINIAEVFEHASVNNMYEYGDFRKCHTCGKQYVVARAEWIEFWRPDRDILPFKVRVCSWSCVPPKFLYKPKELITME